MGIWTWLRRGEGDDAEEIHTHRAWHALHVALTGEEEGGASPAAWVVWTSPNALEAEALGLAFDDGARISVEHFEVLWP
jgi:hypothetical protein